MIRREQHIYRYLVTLKNSQTWRLASTLSSFLGSFVSVRVAPFHSLHQCHICNHTKDQLYSSLSKPLSLSELSVFPFHRVVFSTEEDYSLKVKITFLNNII